MKKPVIMAGEEVRRADNVLVRIETDDGSVGWGEAASAPTMTGETIQSMVCAIHYLVPALRDRPADDIGGARVAMDGRMYGNHGAKAAIEIALHDLVGRVTKRPVHALLGDQRRSRMAILGVIGGGDLAGDLSDARRKKAEGYAAFKIKVGVDAPAVDAARTRQICDLLGSECLISADANQGFSAEQATEFIRAVAGAGLDFFEQPVAADDLAGMAAVAAARLCESLRMSVNISCKTGESSIACAAALHVASVIPGIAWGLTLTNGGLADDVTARPIHIDQGYVDVLEGPGLGIEVDE